MRNRRLISVILVIVMLFSLSVSAFAAGDSIKDEIVDVAEFTVAPYADSNTVYIEVHIEAYPELAGLGMIHDVSLALYEKQAEYAAQYTAENPDATFALMNQKHIAGELALHILLFRIFYILGGNKEGSIFNEYYNGAKDALLNINENRLSPVLMEMVGSLILAFGSISGLTSSVL